MSALVWAYLQVDGQGGWLEGFMLVTRTVCCSQQILKSVPMNDFIELKYRLDGITFQHPDNNVFFILIRNLLCHNSDEYFWGYWICPFHKGTVSQKCTLKETFFVHVLSWCTRLCWTNGNIRLVLVQISHQFLQYSILKKQWLFLGIIGWVGVKIPEQSRSLS